MSGVDPIQVSIKAAQDEQAIYDHYKAMQEWSKPVSSPVMAPYEPPPRQFTMREIRELNAYCAPAEPQQSYTPVFSQERPRERTIDEMVNVFGEARPRGRTVDERVNAFMGFLLVATVVVGAVYVIWRNCYHSL